MPPHPLANFEIQRYHQSRFNGVFPEIIRPKK